VGAEISRFDLISPWDDALTRRAGASASTYTYNAAHDGQFMSLDSKVATTLQPDSYADNDPVNGTDPEWDGHRHL
jgi:hypothetical protein